MNGHAPEVPIERVIEAWSFSAQWKLPAVRCRARGADDQIPGIVGMDSNQFRGGRTHFVQSIIPAVLDGRSYIQCAFEYAHADREFVEIATIRPICNHSRPLEWLLLTVCLPNLKSTDRVESANIELVVERRHFKAGLIVSVTKTSFADGPPGLRSGVFHLENDCGV